MVDSVMQVIPQALSVLSELAPLLSAIAALASVIIACVAVWFSHKQMNMHEQHNRLMATPHLSGWNHVEDATGTYIFTLENNGLGPAIVREISLWVDGVLQEGAGTDLVDAAVQQLFSAEAPSDYGAEMFTVGEFIAVGKKFNILTVRFKDKGPDTVRAYVAEKAKLQIRYDSILGDSYFFDSDKD